MPPLVMKVFEPFSTQRAAVADRGRAHAARVGAGAGLGEAPAADLLAPRERREEPPLLLLAAGEVDVGRGEAVVGGERERDARVAAGQLLHHDRPVEHATAPSRRTPAGQHTPASPSSPRFANSSRGKACFSSHSRACGRSSASAKSRTVVGGAPALRSARSPRSHGIPQRTSMRTTAPPPAASSRSLARSPPSRRGSSVGLPPRSEVRALATTNPGADAAHGRSARRRRGRRAARPGRSQRCVPLSRVSRHLIHAVVSSEDQNFFGHEGVDWKAIQESIEKDVREAPLRARRQHDHPAAREEPLLRHREDAASASCASWSSRSWLEDDLTKARILALYLNVIEWGDGVYGCEAAARHWYGKPALGLSARPRRPGLAAMIPNPRRINPRVSPEPPPARDAARAVADGQAGYIGRDVAGLGAEPPAEPVEDDAEADADAPPAEPEDARRPAHAEPAPSPRFIAVPPCDRAVDAPPTPTPRTPCGSRHAGAPRRLHRDETADAAPAREDADVDTSSDELRAPLRRRASARTSSRCRRASPSSCSRGSPGASVLDVGGGHGQTTGALVEAGHAVTSSAATPRARRACASGRARGGRASSPPTSSTPASPTASFDVVLSYRLLPHARRCRGPRRDARAGSPGSRWSWTTRRGAASTPRPTSSSA